MRLLLRDSRVNRKYRPAGMCLGFPHRQPVPSKPKLTQHKFVQSCRARYGIISTGQQQQHRAWVSWESRDINKKGKFHIFTQDGAAAGQEWGKENKGK